MNVTIYSTTTCPYCSMLKDFFKEKGIEYEEKMVDRDDDARKKMLEVSEGFLGVPFTVIEKNGEIHTVIGFDKHKIDQVLELD